jgi:protease IV
VYHGFEKKEQLVLKKILLGALRTLAGTALTLTALAGAGGLVFRILRPRVPRRVILELDLTAAFPETQPRRNILGMLTHQPPSLYHLIRHIDHAGADRRVLMLVARIAENPMGYAKIQELRDAVIRFRRPGKQAVAFAETFGETGPANKAYYLATAFDEVYLQPTGQLALTGMVSEVPFLKNLLAKLDVKPRIDGRKEFKSAKNLFTESGFTAPHEENLRTVLGSLQEQVIEETAKRRNMNADTVRSHIDGAPYDAKRAADLGFVDGLLYYDELLSRIKSRHGGKPKFHPFAKYASATGRMPFAGRGNIALIFGVGDIYRGVSRVTPFGSILMGAESVTRAIREAVEDDSIKAIVLRIDSPGGSALASDMMWREVSHARERGKPVIASMSDVAASGGYYIAMAADKIILDPGTITGSIGVVSGKLALGGLWKKLGVDWGEIHTGQNAAMWLPSTDFSPQQWNIVERQLDAVYNDFVAKAARGRAMHIDKMESLARGKVYTGADAVKAGLADGLGGLWEAIEAARRAAGLPGKGHGGVRIYSGGKGDWRSGLLAALMADWPPPAFLGKIASLPIFTALQRQFILDDPALLLMNYPFAEVA